MPEKYAETRELKLVRSMTGWDYANSIRLHKNPTNDTEHMIANVYFEANTEFKICEGALTYEKTIDVNLSCGIIGFGLPLWAENKDNSNQNDPEENIHVYDAWFYSFYVGDNAEVWISKA